jgi:hypothetical protein
VAEDTIGEIIQKFVSLRDELTEWKRSVDEEERRRKAELTKLEVILLGKADELGVDSFKTEYGTAYKTMEEHFRVQDWNAFVEYVKETGNFSLFQKRVTKTAAKDVLVETGELPRGLDRYQEFKINVRRPANGSKKGGGDSNGD